MTNNPMSTLPQAAPLATQSHNTHTQLLYLPECLPDTASWIYPNLHLLESDTPIDGLADSIDSYPFLAASPQSLAGLGIFCPELITSYAPDLFTTAECPLMDIQANPKDVLFGSEDTLHLALPHYDHMGTYLGCQESNVSGTFDYSLSHWSSGLVCTDNHMDDSDSSISTISKTTSTASFYELFQMPLDATPPMLPIVADINMFELAWSKQSPSTTINPADTLIVPDPELWTGDDLDSPMPTSSSPVVFKFPLSNDLSAEFVDELLSILTASGTLDQAPLYTDEPFIKVEDNNPPFVVHQPLNTSPPRDAMPLPQYTAHVTTSDSFNLVKSQPPSPPKPQTGGIHSANIVQAPRRSVKVQENDLPNMGTPVLDAHHGIYLPELQAKAERYRQRNPGQDIDKRWLNSFAGKLSERGELLADFRCYVVGCFQTNKRRDHILIHVGSHVDQRPFVCRHCPMRFLRKNECKRHEASHTGDKPYVCEICPMREKAFVRLDLLRRHLKRAHAVDKENVHRSTKKPKLYS